MSDALQTALTKTTRRPALIGNWGRSLHIDIASDQITVSQSVLVGFGRRITEVLHRQDVDADGADIETVLADKLRAALVAVHAAKCNMSVTLADELVRMWIVTPPGNASSVADCEAAAMLRFQALFGESALHWEIVADWDAQRPFLACAVARTMLDRIHQVCAEFKLSVQQVAPQFVATWNRFRKAIQPDAWLAVLHRDTLTIGALDQRKLISVRMVTVPAEVMHKKSWLDQHIQREALLFNLKPPKRLQIRGVIPPQWQKNDAGQLHCYPLGLVDAGNPVDTAMSLDTTRTSGTA
jgi:hypothetical protein